MKLAHWRPAFSVVLASGLRFPGVKPHVGLTLDSVYFHVGKRKLPEY